jgi:hypothetical protein
MAQAPRNTPVHCYGIVFSMDRAFFAPDAMQPVNSLPGRPPSFWPNEPDFHE